MSLRFYDTATAGIRDFVPLSPGRAGLYYCGATVQGMPHIGHLRSALVFDQLSRWLRYRGFEVTTIRNVTDIDDKILANAAASTADPNLPTEEWWELAFRFEQEFEAAYDAIGVERPSYEPRATGHIPEMHRLIAELMERGHAYAAADGSGDVYFDVRSWPAYGSLTRQKIDDMQAAPDVDPQFAGRKKDPRDFALWKGYKAGEPLTASWPGPWGAGRPGWHLECSAMATKYLGQAFDFHGGGLDLRFPHHENEMAQSQAAGHRFASIWLHNGMVTYAGEKMSKSVGNTISPAEMLNEARPLVVRYYLGQAHYRSVLDYRPGSLQEAAAAVERIEGFMLKATARLGADSCEPVPVPSAFGDAMDEDLNVPAALAVVHDTVRRGNSALADDRNDDAAAALAELVAMTDALGINPLAPRWQTGSERSAERRALDALIRQQLEERRNARENRDWERADSIRNTLAAAGIVVEDSPGGASWSLSSR